MSLLDDARRIMHAGPATYGEWECVLCHRDGKDRLIHTDNCPWLAMPKIVKALEALDEYIDAIEVSRDSVNVPRRVNAYRVLRGIVRGDQ